MTTIVINIGRRGLGLREQIGLLIVGSTVLALPFCEHPLLVAGAGGVAVLMLALLWTRRSPPLLLLPAAYQFMQVTIALYYSTISGKPLWTLSLYGSDLGPGIMTGLLGLAFLILGMRIASTGLIGRRIQSLPALDLTMPPSGAFRLCVALYLASILIAMAAASLPMLRQPLGAISEVKWVGIFFLSYVSFRLRSGYIYVIIIVLFEIFVGFLGFFSTFKDVFFVVFIAFVSARARLKFRDVAILLGLAALLFALSYFWITVRPEYRNFLNEGSGAQAVLKPVSERIDFLTGRAGKFEDNSVEPQVEIMVRRASYVEFLSMTLENVPKVLPHTDGSLIGGATAHIFMPRVLFPDKPPLANDTDLTVKYAGVALGGANMANASISIGYLGELYIDFGYLGVILGTFLVGCGYGWAYRYFITSRTGSVAINASLALMVIMTGMQFEKSLTKTIGGGVAAFLAAWLLKRYVPIAERYFSRRRKGKAVTPAEPADGGLSTTSS